jgi:FkbM family methyltransferase
MDCPCRRCSSDPGHPRRTLHQQLRAVVQFLEPEARASVADLPLEEADVLAEIVGLSPDRLEQHRQASKPLSPLRAAAALSRLAADEPSRLALEDCARPGPDARRPDAQVVLNVNGRPLKMTLPPNPQSLFVLHEIFVKKTYHPPAPVQRVYDFGANIGAATLYFSSVLPHAEYFCIEPEPENLRYLRANIADNELRATVLPAALAAGEGRVTLWQYPRGGHGLHSLVLKSSDGLRARPLEVPAVTLENVVSGSDYGLKLDVEGAEHDALADRRDLLAGARWVVGELHYWPDLAPATALRLSETLSELFSVERGLALFMWPHVTRAFRAKASTDISASPGRRPAPRGLRA